MAGTPAGGRKAARTMKKKYGKGHMATIGSKGGKSRKKPYNHFDELAKNNPEALKELATKAGRAGKREVS